MSSLQVLRQEFRQHFSYVIMRWGVVKQNINSEELIAIHEVLGKWIEWTQKEGLNRLEKFLNEILNLLPNEYPLSASTIEQISEKIDLLIESAKHLENPYLLKQALTESKPKIHGGSLNIALIDDSEIARVTIKAMLDRFNYNVLVYESIFDFEADTEVLNTVDIILLDVVMPDVTEDMLFDFAQRIRQKNIQIILVSGSDSLDIRLKAVRADIGGYVTKPFDINVLVGNIRWLCNIDVRRPYQVSLLDDQPMVGSFFGKYAKNNDIDLTFYSNSTEFFEGLEVGKPDLFLLDVNMPKISGIEVCKILRQQQRFEYVPIVFLSADTSLKTKLAALEAGADDVIIKDNPPDIIFKQIERRITRGQQIRNMAIKDSLTGLLNHGQMMEAAHSAHRLAKRNNTSLVVAMIDIDNFKQVNDKRGHMIGDNVIVGLAQLLKTSVRDTDVVGRYGGEEFLIVFHSDDIESIEKKLNDICFTFSKLSFKDGYDNFHCTFSCGVAGSSHAEELKDMIHLADQTMYDVKKDGKNAVKIYK
ncbi:diguanylate cyclase [Alteromonas sp. 5E99-2]|uniref:GGDEF domain-containing response regulator n=1 Tax=Alteromonas sp. 5E99-2 TaxID=2817683 RepID=UPI001A997B10|nr:response regulator [Alteromonas sp. 5E99-2]MBO1256174.1 diguanylate cyclase [Alteromonas sp. 5E99-2]